MGTTLYATFQQNVNRLLRRKDMTRKMLAAVLDVHKSQVTHVLNGRQVPTLETIEKWADALEVKPFDLLFTVVNSELSLGEIASIVNTSQSSVKD